MSSTVAPPLVAHPPQDVERYRREGWWSGRTLFDEVWEAFETHAAHVALVTEEVRWTYAELAERATTFAGGLLLATSLRPGDAVMFSAGNVVETVVAFYGALRAGLVPVCTLPQHGSRELSLLAEHTGARAIFAQADFRRRDLVGQAVSVAQASTVVADVVALRGDAPTEAVGYEHVMAAGRRPAAGVALAAVDVDPASVVVLQLSGGTTGLPKVAPRTHEEYAYNARRWAEVLRWGPGTTVLYPLPLLHNAGIVLALLPSHLCGATLVLTADAECSTILDAIDAEHPDVLPLCPPAVAVRLLEEPRARTTDLSCLADLVVGGQRMPVETAVRLEAELGIRCRQMFGMAEGTFLLTPPGAPDAVRLHTVGEPMSPGDEVRVYGVGTETEVPDGAEGELCTRGPYTIRGYYRAPEHNASAFTADGFYRTGDIARRHVVQGRSYYSIDGRLKDVINRGVEKIHAEEVEEVVVQHPHVVIAAVVAMPCPVLGERACAFLVQEEGTPPLDVAALGSHLRAHGLSTYKLPERVEVIAAMPLTNVGKVSKKDLRAMIADLLTAEGASRA